VQECPGKQTPGEAYLGFLCVFLYFFPFEKVDKFIRLELGKEKITAWNGLDIASIHSDFNVSYDMTLTWLKTLGIIGVLYLIN
jgi:hypothetical protein